MASPLGNETAGSFFSFAFAFLKFSGLADFARFIYHATLPEFSTQFLGLVGL